MKAADPDDLSLNPEADLKIHSKKNGTMFRKSIVYSLSFMIVLVLSILIFLGVTISTHKGSRMVWGGMKNLMGERIQGNLDEGTFLSGGVISDFFFQSHPLSSSAIKIKIDRFQWKWNFHWKPWSLKIDFLKLGNIEVLMHASQKASSPVTIKKLSSFLLPVSFDSVYISRLRVYETDLYPSWHFPKLKEFISLEKASGDKTLKYEFEEVNFSIHYEDYIYKLNIHHVSALGGKLQGNLSLKDNSSLDILGDLYYSIPRTSLDRYWINKEDKNELLKIHLNLSGSLINVVANLKMTGMVGSAQGILEFGLFENLIFKKISLESSNFNPALLFKNAPNADLAINISIKPSDHEKNRDTSFLEKIVGSISIYNASPGKLDDNRFPFSSGSMSVVLEKQKLWHLNLAHLLCNDGSMISGKGVWSFKDGGKLTLSVGKLNLQSFYSFLRPSEFNGLITLLGNNLTRNFDIQLVDERSSIDMRASFTNEINIASKIGEAVTESFSIDRFVLKMPRGLAIAKGKFSNNVHSEDFLTCTFSQFNPFFFIADSSTLLSSLNKSVSIKDISFSKGLSNHQPILNLSGKFGFNRFFDQKIGESINNLFLDFKKSFYDGSPLYAKGGVQFSKKAVLNSDMFIKIADNYIKLFGKLVDESDEVHFRVLAPRLDKLGFGLRGNLDIKGDLLGNTRKLRCYVDYHVNEFVLGDYRVGHALGKARFSNIENDKLLWQTTLKDIFFPDFLLSRVDLKLNGSYAKHNLAASVLGMINRKKIDVDLLILGQLGSGKKKYKWQGVLHKLLNRGDPYIKVLSKPVSIELDDKTFEVGPADIEIEGARVSWSFLKIKPDEITSIGYFRNFGGKKWLRFYEKISGQAFPIDGDLAIDGDWNFSITDSSSRGFIIFKRHNGDVTSSSNNVKTPFGIERLESQLKFSGVNDFYFSLQGFAAQFGSFDINLSSSFKKNEITFYLDETALVSGKFKTHFPNLANISRLLGGGYDLNGRLFLNVKIDGRINKPILNGALVGTDLSLSLLDSGFALRDGSLDILLNEKFIDLRKVIFKGGDGSIRVSGKINLNESDPNVVAIIKADKLEVCNSPERQLVVSGEGTIKNHTGKFGVDINGKVFIDRALFDLPKFASPKLGDDVMILDTGSLHRGVKKQRNLTRHPASKFTPFSHIVVGLGNNFRFQAGGAKLDLLGQLIVKSEPTQSVKGYGEIRIGEGSSYEFMGRKFAVENGVVAFDGPIDNPSLHLRAMRRNQEVEAGLRIAGTVKMPTIDFVSEPPDLALEEKLSWLLFGRGSQLASNFGQEAASNAALGVLSGLGGKALANRVGLDSFSIGASDGGVTAPQVLQISKAFGEKLLLGHEYGLSTSESLFKAVWQFSRYWSIAAHLGNAHVGKLKGYILNFFSRFD